MRLRYLFVFNGMPVPDDGILEGSLWRPGNPAQVHWAAGRCSAMVPAADLDEARRLIAECYRIPVDPETWPPREVLGLDPGQPPYAGPRATAGPG